MLDCSLMVSDDHPWQFSAAQQSRRSAADAASSLPLSGRRWELVRRHVRHSWLLASAPGSIASSSSMRRLQVMMATHDCSDCSDCR